MFRELIAALSVIGLSAASTQSLGCVEGDIRGEAITQEREVGATLSGETANFHLLGAGWFRALEIVKEGGSSNRTSITLELDGTEMITTTFSTLKNAWNQLATPFIVANVRTEGNTETMTIWYSPELKFRAMVGVRIDVLEDGVERLRIRTVMNKPAPHEHIPGQMPTALALPAFK